MHDVYNADEAFLTSTSLCLCPVKRVNGRPIGGPELWGPISARLRDAYAELVGVDFVAQYLAYAGGAGTTPLGSSPVAAASDV